MATGDEQQPMIIGEEQQPSTAGVSVRKKTRALTPLTESLAEAPTGAVALQAALQEIRQLREERMQQQILFASQLQQRDEARVQQQANFEAQLHQRDEVLRRMEERIRLQEQQNQLSRLNNNSEIRSVNVEETVPCVVINKELGYKLKPDIYDGTVPLREFFSQFELIARANSWSEATKNVALISSLRGKARAVLECVENVNSLTYAELKSKLELRFGEGYLSQTYYSQFTNRKQKLGEDEATLGSDIERLSQLAYPECPHQTRDKIACAQFVAALSNTFVKRTLQLEGLTSLKMAIQRAMAIRAIQESNLGNQKNFNNKFEKNFERKFNKCDGEKNGNNFKNKSKNNERSEGKKFSGRNFEGRKKIVKECWQCGSTGHFRAECPSLKNKVKEN